MSKMNEKSKSTAEKALFRAFEDSTNSEKDYTSDAEDLCVCVCFPYISTMFRVMYFFMKRTWTFSIFFLLFETI